MQQKVADFLKNWAIPTTFFLITATSTATATWVITRQEQKYLERRVETLETSISNLDRAFDRKHDVGPDGFLDPVLHSRVDRHIEHYMESHFGASGWRDLLRDYADHPLNREPVKKEQP